jgi:[ribosomal protein S18]-alanine N-acetyltransferase
MPVIVRPLVPGEGAAIGTWRYPAPYDIYNDDHGTTDDPAAATEALAIVEDDELVGFCSFGADARVPGGTYRDGPVDLGIGMRPDLTGRGRGQHYLAAVIDHAQRALGAPTLRATVAEVNARALRLCERAGFVRIARFENTDRAYWILERA